MARLRAGSLGRVSDRETKYLEDDRCRRSFRLYYQESYLSWSDERRRRRRCVVGLFIDYFIELLTLGELTHLTRTYGVATLPDKTFRMQNLITAKIRSARWKIVKADWLRGK